MWIDVNDRLPSYTLNGKFDVSHNQGKPYEWVLVSDGDTIAFARWLVSDSDWEFFGVNKKSTRGPFVELFTSILHKKDIKFWMPIPHISSLKVYDV